MYPADRQNSISRLFPGLTCFRHFDGRANLASRFLIAYTNSIGNEVLQSFDIRQNTFRPFENYTSTCLELCSVFLIRNPPCKNSA